MPVEPVTMRPEGPVPPSAIRAWEQLAVRVPRRVQRWMGRFFLWFPPGSPLRRWFLLGLSALAWEATARTRFDLVLPIWDPDCVWRSDATARTLGFDEVYSGHDGVKRALSQFNEIWTGRSFTMRELLDGGDTIVMRMTISGRGVRSRAPAEMKMSAVARLDPFIVDYCNFFDDVEALREAGFDAVGLREQARSGRVKRTVP